MYHLPVTTEGGVRLLWDVTFLEYLESLLESSSVRTSLPLSSLSGEPRQSGQQSSLPSCAALALAP